MGMLPLLALASLALAQVMGLGAPKAVATLDEMQLEIVQFATAQLQGGEHGACRRDSTVEGFTQQVVAGTMYRFDLVLEHGEGRPAECEAAGSGREVCHMVVWDKPWEQYREVQWDQVECDRPDEPEPSLLGAGDHDRIPHGSNAKLLGSGDHDLVPHASEAPALLGGDGHDSQPHGEADAPSMLRVGLTAVRAAVRVGLVLPGEVADPVQGTGKGPLPHTKKAVPLLGAGAHGPLGSTAWTQKELLRQGESRRQLKKLQSLTAFHAFMSEHNRSYVGREEYKRRYAVFRDNMKKVQFLQETEQGTGEYGATAMADLTETEFKQRFLGWKKQRDDPEVHWPAADIPDVELPKEHDWRTLNAVTPVKNQGACGSCWAFSVTGNVEGQQAIKHGELLSLSEQELVDCDTRDNGCNGGLPENAYKTLFELGGLELESDYGYDGKDETCQYNRSSVAVRVAGGLEISTDETAMAKWLLKNGPISVGLNANAMQFYKGGVSHPWKFLCSPDGIDHGVLIVGFGEHEYPLFHKKMPYWTIKNSWGTGWGEQGYYRLFRGEGTCGINMMTSSAVIA